MKGLLDLMDQYGIDRAMIGVAQRASRRASRTTQRALREHPDRFFGCVRGRPQPRAWTRCATSPAAYEELGVKAASAFPCGLNPQVPINDKKFFPIYAKCIELDIPIYVCAGVPGPRVPFAPQYVGLIDEVCWFFPELKFVTRHGCEPWADLAVKLLLKWPNLYYSTSAFAPKYYPKDVVDFANTRGADKVMYAGYFPMGLSLERIFSEMPDVPFRDHVWPKFLRENAVRVFKLGGLTMSQRSVRSREGRRCRSTPRSASRSRARRCTSSTASSGSRRATPASKEGGELEFPAGYMFKDVPKWDAEEHRRPGRRSSSPSSTATTSRRRSSRRTTDRPSAALREYPDRFFAGISVDPNEGMEALRKIDTVGRGVRPQVRARVPRGPVPAGRDQRQEVLSDLHEVR